MQDLCCLLVAIKNGDMYSLVFLDALLYKVQYKQSQQI